MISVQPVDITTLRVDAIVNAAGRSLRGGGGVDGAIHKAAGPKLLQACIEVGPCEPGSAKITAGFRLPSRMVIHTVGPRWRGGGYGEAELLASCYQCSMELAREHGVRTLAFPAISCGVFGFPMREGAKIAVEEVRSMLAGGTTVEKVIFACPANDALAAFAAALS